MSPSPEPSTPPAWFDPADPWASTRMRQYTEILAAETEIGEALTEALSKLLDAARASGAITADAGPWGKIWRGLLNVVANLVLALFRRRFLAENAADAQLAAQLGAQYARAVLDRLAQWPDQIAAEIDAERAAGREAGLSEDAIADRVTEMLTITAPTAAVRAEAERLQKTIDDPDTRPGVRREARRRLTALQRRGDRRATRRWWHKVVAAARTEAMSALNAGTDAGATTFVRRTRSQRFRQWWSMEDSKVRATHRIAHGQIRKTGDLFIVGGFPMRFPGDPLAPADLVVNCRCSLLVLTATEARQEIRRRVSNGRAIRAAADPEGGMGMSDTVITPEVEVEAPAVDLLADGALPSGAATQRWRGVLAPLGVRSGDRRMLMAPPDGEPVSRDLPLPLLWQEKTAPGHDDAVVVGRIDRVWIEDSNLMGDGVFNLNRDEARDIVRDIDDGFARWVSVGIDNTSNSYRCYRGDDLMDCEELSQQLADGLVDEAEAETVEIAEKWRLISATGLAQPAFQEAFIWLVHDEDEDADEEPVEAAPPEPAVVADAPDGAYADKPDADEELPPWLRKKTKGTGKAVTAAAVTDAAASAPKPDTTEPPPSLPPSWKEPAVKPALARPGLTADAAPARTTSWCEAVATNVPVEPAPDWFVDPQLTGPTKVRVTDEGRVFGHIAAWNSRHAALPHVTPPRAADKSYARFHRHPVRCSDGSKVKTGPLATGGHAELGEYQIWAVQRHYDDPNFVVADVVCGEDAHGIWVAGALRYGVSPFQVMILDRYSFSGDWREHELVAACAVSVPGFHLDDDASVVALAASAGESSRSTLAESVTRSRTDESGEIVALIAAGIVAPPTAAKDRPQVVTLQWDSAQFATELAAALKEADVAGTRVTAAETAPDAAEEPDLPAPSDELAARVAEFRNRVHAPAVAGLRRRVGQNVGGR